jgi:hypothetical protein|nr:MAG TPA: hypothetical protein [Caudoviricetes sp.]
MNTAGQHLTEYHKKLLKKEAKYEKKVRTRRIESLTIEEHVKLKSIMSQFYCTVALQIELVDALEEMKISKAGMGEEDGKHRENYASTQRQAI